MSLRGQSWFEGYFTILIYVIGSRLLVHCTEGNCSIEVPLSEVYLYTSIQLKSNYPVPYCTYFAYCACVEFIYERIVEVLKVKKQGVNKHISWVHTYNSHR